MKRAVVDVRAPGTCIAHASERVNYFCPACDALVIAGRVAHCPAGHARLLPPDAGPSTSWCGECQAFGVVR